MRSFLNFVTYLGNFVPNFSDISEPRWKLLQKPARFDFGKEQIVEKLKEVLVSHKILGLFHIEAETRPITDANPIGLVAVLVQIQEGTPKAIACANRSLTAVETRYSQTEKEGLSMGM